MYKNIKTIYKKTQIITSIIFIIFTLQIKFLFAESNNDNINAKKLNEIIKLIENNNLNKAFQIAKSENSDDLINLIEWITIFSKKEIKTEELIKKYKKYRNWPKANFIRVLIEKRISWDTDNSSHYEFLTQNNPISALGKMKLANYKNEPNNINQIIINNWIYNSFSEDDEKFIMNKYSHIFDQNTKHIRLDYLIWNKKWASVYRQLQEIETDHKYLYEARIKLSRKKYGVDSAIQNIPQHLKNDEGLTYERIKWRRHAKLNSSLKLLKSHLNNDEELKYKDKWWNEIIIHTRSLLKDKKYLAAYNLLSKHNQISSSNVSKAEWLLGWIALTHLSKTELARQHFLNVKSVVNMPISLARAYYWLAVTEKKLNNIDLANKYFAKAAIHNTTFYGLIAEETIKQKISTSFINIESENIVYDDNISIFNALRLLARANEKKYSSKFINGFFQKKISKQEIINILKIVYEEKRPDLYIKTCKKAVRISIEFQNCLFPYPNNLNIKEVTKYIDTALIFAIIKQESEFYTNAISRAGAQGLMQIMPYTGKTTAQILNIKYDKNKILNNSNYNITIGSKYFSQLLLEFQDSLVLSIASYNAGPTNVRKWLKVYGDPRKNEISYIDWIEFIPFAETRNYVQRVIENYIIYQKVILNHETKKHKSISEFIKNE